MIDKPRALDDRFLNRKAIERWLADIEPAERRRGVALALAARAALRVVPLLSAGLSTQRAEALVTFGRAAAAWAIAKYPGLGDAFLISSAHNAYGSRAAPHAGAAAASAAYAAVAAARATDGSGSDAFLISSAAEAVEAAFKATATNVATAKGEDFDVAFINSGRSGVELVGLPLWPKGGTPDWAADDWRNLKAVLLDADEGWEVWTDWYEARLAGDDDNHPLNEALEIARASIPKEIWGEGSAVVNAEIQRLIAEHQSLQQRPAAFQFRVIDDRIDALPDDAWPIAAREALDLYEEAKRKGKIVKDRLQRAQADENLRAHVDLLLTRLGEAYPEMRPGLMVSVLRSLESDVRAYDSEEGRKELSAALLSNILDLADSVRDLCAIFPRSREIEAEAVSLDLPMQQMPEIRSVIDAVIEKVSVSDGATEGGREAINVSAAGLAHQRGLAEEAKQSAYFLVDFANFTRAGLKHLKTTGMVIGHELGGLGEDGWRAVRRGAPKGIERGAAQAGKALVVGGVAALMHTLGSDLAALGSMVAAYAPLHEILERMTGAPSEAPPPDAAPVDTEAEAPRAPASGKPKTRRSPAKTPTRKRTSPRP
jgi:hypothetical protein